MVRKIMLAFGAYMPAAVITPPPCRLFFVAVTEHAKILALASNQVNAKKIKRNMPEILV